MSNSKKPLTDVSDSELESMLLSKANEKTSEQLHHEGMDHLVQYSDLPVPSKEDTATPEAAQDWAEREIIRATPRAAQEMINQLRRGSAKERMEASKQILDRAGLQGSARITNNSTVVVLTADTLANIPWAKKFEDKRKAEQLVEGEVVQVSKVD